MRVQCGRPGPTSLPVCVVVAILWFSTTSASQSIDKGWNRRESCLFLDWPNLIDHDVLYVVDSLNNNKDGDFGSDMEDLDADAVIAAVSVLLSWIKAVIRTWSLHSASTETMLWFRCCIQRIHSTDMGQNAVREKSLLWSQGLVPFTVSYECCKFSRPHLIRLFFEA